MIASEFLIAIQFLTRIPIKLNHSPTDKQIQNSIAYYPLVGLIIGVILVLTSWISPLDSVNVTAAIILLCWILITGALHLDGLADSADSWIGGAGSKEKTLEIMKDPRCGPVAVVILVSLLLLKFTLISELLHLSLIVPLLFTPAIARFCACLLFLYTPYVRNEGLGSDIANFQPGKIYLATFLFFLSALILFAGLLTTLTIILISFVCFFSLRAMMIKRLGGITGDTTGALIEITEVAILFGFAISFQ